jgi:3-hydroxyacyl-[acyl-carrier-protein] dehydratase
VSEHPQATLRVPAGHAIFSGHFPGLPLVPGVMLLEWVLREASAAASLQPHELRIRESKFFSPLRPDEEALLFLEARSGRQAFRVLRGTDVLAAGVLEPV